MSLTRQAFDEYIRKNTYRVAMKADGVRYFLMVDPSGIYLVGMLNRVFKKLMCVDRKYWIHKVRDVELPESLSKGICILDGELVKITGTIYKYSVEER